MADSFRQITREQAMQYLKIRQISAPPRQENNLQTNNHPQVKDPNEEIDFLKQNLTDIRIMLHGFTDKRLRDEQDYKMLKETYEKKSKFLSKRFCFQVIKDDKDIKTLRTDIFQKLEIPVKLYVHSKLIIDDKLWQIVQPYLEHQLVISIIVKAQPNWLQDQKERCEARFKQQFSDQSRYDGFVQNFTDALELQRKILNLQMMKLKPNFLILNKHDRIDTLSSLTSSYQDILINTKAYLKESLDIKTKQSLTEYLQLFQAFINQECDNKYKMLRKQNKLTNKQIEKQEREEKQKLDQFLNSCEKAIQQNFLSNEERKRAFLIEIINMYTLQTVVYGSVNNLCKTITSPQKFRKIGFYCKFLNEAIKQLGRTYMARQRQDELKILYRGTFMDQLEWKQLTSKESAGGFIINLSFMSTSRDKKVALSFMKKDKRIKNNILIEITINSIFWKYYDKEPYCQYLQLFIEPNIIGAALKSSSQEEFLFNCFNVFKIIGFQDNSEKERVLKLQAFSHLEIIQRKINKELITKEQQMMLDTIIRLEKQRDYTEKLKEEGRVVEMAEYIEKSVKDGVDINVNQAENFIQFIYQNNKESSIQSWIDKISHNKEATVQSETTLAIIQSVREQFFQTEFKLLEATKLSNKKQTSESWSVEMEKANLKHMLAISKEKIGCYQECIDMIKENLFAIDTRINIIEFQENIEVWKEYCDYLLSQKQLPKQLIPFEQVYPLAISTSIKRSNVIGSQEQTKQILEFLNMQTYKQFFCSFFRNLNPDKFGDRSDLRRDMQIYKDRFYKRSQLKVKILNYFYQVLIKCERIEQVKQSAQSASCKLFDEYFNSSKPYFDDLDKIHRNDNSDKYKFERALFFEGRALFLRSQGYFFEKKPEQQKMQLMQVSKIFSDAKSLLKEINKEHEQLSNIQNIQDNMAEQLILTDKRNKRASLMRRTRLEDSRYDDQSDIFKQFEQLKQRRQQNAMSYRKKKSFLNQTQTYSSMLNLTIDIASNQTIPEKQREGCQNDINRLNLRITAILAENKFLTEHSVNAFYKYLKGLSQFYKGHYQSTMFYINQCEQILQKKLENSKKRIKQEKNQEIKKQQQIKLQTFKQNNEVRIKICILKSKICIYYKPNIHDLCITGLREQEEFITGKLEPANSNLPEIYYCLAYLYYLEHRSKETSEMLQLALNILAPKNNQLKKYLLKYYILIYLNESDRKKQAEVNQIIEKIASQNQINVKQIGQINKINIEEHEAYYLYCIQRRAVEKGVRLDNIIENNFHKDTNLLNMIEGLNDLFQPQMIQYWEFIKHIFEAKKKSLTIIGYKLCAYYFIYAQYLSKSKQTKTILQGFNMLDQLIQRLVYSVENSEKNRTKHGLKQQQAYENKMKIILMQTYSHAQKQSSTLPSSITKPMHTSPALYLQDYKDFMAKYFSNKIKK